VDLYNKTWTPAPAPTTYDDRAWATVLRENVVDDLVDYDHLVGHAGPLQAHLGLVAVVGPRSTPQLFPTNTHRLAYYVNAFNAGVLQAVLYLGIPPTVHDVGLPPFEQTYRIRLDGKMRSLAEVRRMAYAEPGSDARIVFAMCNAARGSPPLSGQPLRPSTLWQQLQRLAREAMENPRLVKVDHENRRLLVGNAIFHNRKAFLSFPADRTRSGRTAPSVLSALLSMAGGARREWLNTAVGYEVRALPFDRSLNRRKPAGL
jgi:hypothetical protein